MSGKSTSFEDRPKGLDERSGDLEERPESHQAPRKKKGSCLSCQMFYNDERLKTTWTY
jgi:hypothetical protein